MEEVGLRGCLHLKGWAQVQKHKWYPAWRMKAIGSGVSFQKQRSWKWDVAQILGVNSKRRAMAH
jgi:hypothetical protein